MIPGRTHNECKKQYEIFLRPPVEEKNRKFVVRKDISQEVAEEFKTPNVKIVPISSLGSKMTTEKTGELDEDRRLQVQSDKQKLIRGTQGRLLDYNTSISIKENI